MGEIKGLSVLNFVKISLAVALSFFTMFVPAKAETLFDTFVKVCADDLHHRQAASEYLHRLGWQEKPFKSFKDISILGNILDHGLVEDEAHLFVSRDGKSAFLFGRKDNDLNPNNVCLLSTTEQRYRDFVNWMESQFEGQEYSEIKGKRFGNTKMSWRSRSFPRNLSISQPYTAGNMHIGLRHTPFTNARFQVSVTGLIP
ncbi:hypothetical protein C8N32_1161 [Rhodovulum imhoffii]|uniref:Uncharacterized protein n=2 Tax=Rhodovulum imhoffii TaxID=365340 RepID=A0A2T5BPW5_9RHOB|nr:hypothetical protein C8N32_1161 [Rhodovulum imhoffii]